MEPFIHLHVHTQYSLLDGQASIDALIDKAQKDGMPAIAVTDHGVMFGIKEFFNKVSKKNGKPLGAIKDYEKELKELKSKTELTSEEQARLEEIPAKIEEEKKKIFKPIFGCECYCARNGRHSKLASQNDRSGWHLIVLAKNLNGYKNLIKMVSLSWTEGLRTSAYRQGVAGKISRRPDHMLRLYRWGNSTAYPERTDGQGRRIGSLVQEPVRRRLLPGNTAA